MSDAPADEEFDTMMEVERNPCGAWRAIQAQAAELTRLRANVEAADKLAAASGRIAKTMSDMLTAGDAIRGLSALGRDSLEGEVNDVLSALSAYEGERG